MIWAKALRLCGVFALTFAWSVAAFAGDPLAAYVDGTVTAIPVNTSGDLELGDKTDLRFSFGSNSFSIPYDDITSFHLGRDRQGVTSQIAGGASKVGRTVLPMLFSSPKKYLTVNFQSGDSTTTQHAVFALPGETAKAAIPVLKERTAHNLTGPQYASTADDTNTWWGNRYWKTERNKHLWPDAEKPADTSDKVQVASRDE